MKITRPKSKQPIPSHAKRVFKGEIFDVYQWPQKMYDGSTKTFERIKRQDTATIIPITPDGKIIIAKQEQPGRKSFTGLVGGRVEEGENPLSAAKRELLEETGLSSQKWTLFNTIQPMGKLDWAVYCFIAKDCKIVARQNLDNGEKIKPLYLNFEAFVKMLLKKDFVDMYLKIKFLEAKLDPKKMQALKKLLGVK